MIYFVLIFREPNICRYWRSPELDLKLRNLLPKQFIVHLFLSNKTLKIDMIIYFSWRIHNFEPSCVTFLWLTEMQKPVSSPLEDSKHIFQN